MRGGSACDTVKLEPRLPNALAILSYLISINQLLLFKVKEMNLPSHMLRRRSEFLFNYSTRPYVIYMINYELAHQLCRSCCNIFRKEKSLPHDLQVNT